MRIALGLIGILLASCGGSTTSPSPTTGEPPAAETSDASSPGDETTATPRPSQAEKIDTSRLGPPCAGGRTCPEGERCVTYPGVAEPRCMSVDPCDIVTCPPEVTCMITLTSPGNVACL